MNGLIRFDSVGGASGDMILAALSGLGADLAAIERTINAFFPETLHFHVEPVRAAGLAGTRVSVQAKHRHAHEETWPDVESPHAHGHAHDHRRFADIEKLLADAPVSPRVRGQALDVFRALAEAEASVHGCAPGEVHFHEVGAWDSVADVVGTCLALEQLGVEGVSCGPLPSGTGTLHCAHGEMPNPAPATQLLLAGLTVTQTDEPFELVTPTGAALLGVLSRTAGPVAATATVGKSALGFGSRTLLHRPNVLRATLMAPGEPTEGLLVLETNLDDCNPEWVGALVSDLLADGALDAWQTPIAMKKNRAGILLSVLARTVDAPALRERIFRATTTFGIRCHAVDRETLDRRIEPVQTPWGDVPVKIGLLRGEALTAAPEHDACAALARQHGVAARRIHDAARQAWFSKNPSALGADGQRQPSSSPDHP